MYRLPTQTTAKILIVDDSKTQREILRVFLEGANYSVVSAINGEEAIRMYVQEHPDLVIMDVEMTIMDGITAAKEIRAISSDCYTPIIFVSDAKSQCQLSAFTAAGGDDILNKPINEDFLILKIKALLRVKLLYQSQLEQKSKLLKYQEMVEQEQLVAATLYKNILRAGFAELPILRYSLSPMALFNGDIILSAKAPGNQLYLLLGDFTGHGLSASVGAGPTAEIFYGMVRKGFALSDIALEINRKLNKLLPTSMFLAATLVRLNQATNELQLITCGLPDQVIFNRQTKMIRTVASKNLPLGIIPSFNPIMQVLTVTQHDYLYLFSDGLIESENSEGEQFGEGQVKECLSADVQSHFEYMMERLHLHTGGTEQKDDVTLVELHCDLNEVQWQADDSGVKPDQRVAMAWNTSLSFNIETLKNLKPVPIIVNLLMEIQGLQRYQEEIFRVVNELFENALDYGLLRMDASLRNTPDGLVKYHQIKAERMAGPVEGEVSFIFNHQPTATGGRLSITVGDTGKGFDFEGVLAKIDQKQGIGSVQTACSKLEYVGCGNQVNAIFDWDA